MFSYEGKNFVNYKDLKSYLYFNIPEGKKVKAYERDEDLILKEYECLKKERRLYVTKTYDYEEEKLLKAKKQQLNLF